MCLCVCVRMWTGILCKCVSVNLMELTAVRKVVVLLFAQWMTLFSSWSLCFVCTFWGCVYQLAFTHSFVSFGAAGKSTSLYFYEREYKCELRGATLVECMLGTLVIEGCSKWILKATTTTTTTMTMMLTMTTMRKGHKG